MASLRRAKKQATQKNKNFVENYYKRKRLIKSVNEQIKETNKRLRQLDKKGYYDSFSSKKLFNRLGGRIGALEKTGDKVTKVIINKNMNITQLTAVQKATKQFLNSATSTPAKINKVIRDTKKSMYATLKTENNSLTMKDIESYYEMLGNNDFTTFSDEFGASTMWALIDSSINEEDTKADFIKKLESLQLLNDNDLRKKAERLFDLYVG